MIEKDKVVDALRNCVNKPKCRDCYWEECEEFNHETVELPKGLVMDALDLLKGEETVPLGPLVSWLARYAAPPVKLGIDCTMGDIEKAWEIFLRGMK